MIVIKKNVLKSLIVISLFIAIFIMLLNPEVRSYFRSPEKLKNYILQFKFLAPIVFIILCTLRTFLIGFPLALFAIVSSVLFGAVPGLLYSFIGSFFSGAIGFYMGKYLFKDMVERVWGEKMKKIANMKIKGFNLVLYLRLLLLPYDMLSIAMGTLNIKFKDFIIATILGIMPEFLIYAYSGSFILNAKFTILHKLLLSLCMLLILGIFHLLVQTYKKITKNEI